MNGITIKIRIPEKFRNSLYPVNNNERAVNCHTVTETASNLRQENENTRETK
jgi:hypothetical protein